MELNYYGTLILLMELGYVGKIIGGLSGVRCDSYIRLGIGQIILIGALVID